MRRRITILTLALTAILSARAPAAITGTVLGIDDQTQWGWTAGPLVRIEVPSLTRTTLSSGTCMGPCFSPDGSKVAFSKGDVIHIITNKGTNDSTINVSVPTARMPALYWLTLGGTDYIYWSLGPQGSTNCMDIYRVNKATGVKETVYTSADGVGLKWAGISADGTRAAVTKAYPLFNVFLVDLVKKTEIGRGVGCNASMSPDGTLFTHNTWINELHETAHIEKWDMSSPAESLNDTNLVTKPASAIYLIFHPVSGCQFDTQRFSHSSNDYITYRQYQCTGTPACGNAGVVMNIRTKETVCFGVGCGYDFWNGSLDAVQVAAPVIFPATSAIAASPVAVTMTCATAGASIRYTLDGKTPTSQSTLYQASISVPVAPGASVTVNARAFKGADSSVVNSATYTFAAVKPAFTILSPNGGERVAVGQTIPIRWQGDSTQVTTAVLSVSTDTGRTWHVIAATQIHLGDAQWGNYPWLIPDTVGGIHLANVNALIKVNDYDHPGLFDVSDGVFRIAAAASAVSGPRYVRQAAVEGKGPRVAVEGPSTVVVSDVRGRTLRTASVKAGSTVDPCLGECCVCFVTIKNSRGVSVNKVFVPH